MEKEKNKTFIDRIWDFFVSIKLAIVVFAVLSITSIVGTVIEQNAEPAKNIKLLTKMFGASAAPALYEVFDRLGFMDMYHSWWFTAILILFAANLIICSTDRLPKIMKLVREPIKPLPEDHFKGFGIKKEMVLKGSPEKTRGIVTDAIKRITGFNIEEAKEGRGFQLFSQKGNYTRLGVYITHTSILVILLGAVTGIFLGFKGFLPLPEGQTANVVETRRQEVKPLGFGIRCDEFTVDFYGSSDMPRAYKSRLTIIKDGKEAMTKVIEVNNPLTYEGITFYQSSYGIIPGRGENGIFRFRVTSKNGKAEDVNAGLGGSFTIPGTNITGTIEDFSPALAFDERTGRVFTYADQMNNPAVYISFSEKGKKTFGGWILKRHPDTGKLPEGHIVEFNNLWGFQYTGLQVRRDPGVWIVYLGCTVMAFGLYIAFFMSHRKIWVRLVEEKNNTRVIIGASANKNKQAFERKIDRLANYLAKVKEGGK